MFSAGSHYLNGLKRSEFRLGVKDKLETNGQRYFGYLVHAYCEWILLNILKSDWIQYPLV